VATQRVLRTEPPEIRPKSGKYLVRRLKADITRYEKRYEMTSDAVCQAVKRGHQRETREISRWMQSYAVVNRIAKRTDTTGTRTKTTSRSTRRG